MKVGAAITRYSHVAAVGVAAVGVAAVYLSSNYLSATLI